MTGIHWICSPSGTAGAVDSTACTAATTPLRSARYPVGVLIFSGLLSLIGLAPAAVRADQQAALELYDEAVELKLNAQSMADIERVISLCEKAIAEGLPDGEDRLARQMASMTLYEHANRLSREIFDRQPPDPRWRTIRSFAARDLQKALELQPDLGVAQLLLARLELLPGGDRERAQAAVDRSIELLADDDDLLSDALVVRATLGEDFDRRLADLDRAIELKPSNADAWRTRGLLYLSQGQSDKALDNLLKLLEKSPDDLVAHQAIAEVLASLEKFDEALQHVEAVIANNPRSSAPYQLRARIHLAQEKYEQAESDLNSAIEANPRDVSSLLLRANVRTMLEKLELAEEDVNRALQINPGLPDALLQQAVVLAAQGKNQNAINILLQLAKANPENTRLRLRIGYLYVADQRPSRAIEQFTQALEAVPEDADALRARADALLSLGKQSEAVADYESALRHAPDDAGILNNLAWVLATSPDENLRDAERAIELATKACELTDYKAAHILSTLAAAHAEKGDFETARKWSEKAVELGEDQREQLEQELESYRRNEPWRERQKIQEKSDPSPVSVEDLPLD